MRGFVSGVDFDSRTIKFVNVSNSNSPAGMQPYSGASLHSKIEENKTNDFITPSSMDTETLSYSALVLAVGNARNTTRTNIITIFSSYSIKIRTTYVQLNC